MIVLDPEFAALLAPAARSLEGLMALEGAALRDVDGRRTFRIELGGRGFYVKQHSGVGWRHIAKSLSGLRSPVLGARTEWQALARLAELGIAAPRPVAFAEAGANPAGRRSVLVMTEIAPAISLEDIALGRVPLPGLTERRALIAEVAGIARTLHGAGINHRDLYLCHFLMPVDADGRRSGPLALIDLHRAQMRARVPARWLVKDLSALIFSAAPLALSRADRLRFLAAYEGKPWRHVPAERRRLWAAAAAKAARLTRRLGGPATGDTAAG